MHGALTVIKDGKIGKENKATMEDRDWDISFWIGKNSKGCRPGVEEFSSIALDKRVMINLVRNISDSSWGTHRHSGNNFFHI